jgi:hypothetical protein
MAAPQITDRAHRYRAQKNAPDSPKVCYGKALEYVEPKNEEKAREFLETRIKSGSVPVKAMLAENPSLKGAGRGVLKVYDATIGRVAGFPRKLAGSLVGERNMRRRNMTWHEAGRDFMTFDSQAAAMMEYKRYKRAGFTHLKVYRAPKKLESGLGTGTEGKSWVFTWKRKKSNPSNPEAESQDMYEAFHGKPATSTVIVKEEFHEHKELATLGVLVEFWIAPLTQPGKGVQIQTSDADRDFDEVGADEDTVFLASNEDGTQIYFVGGDQSLDLDALKFKGDWVKDSMVIGVIYELTYRTRKKFDKFELTDYYHELGEESGDQPMLVYDSLSPHCFISGGKYKIQVPLIGMSPGIEN